jgi:hypothetical protein
LLPGVLSFIGPEVPRAIFRPGRLKPADSVGKWLLRTDQQRHAEQQRTGEQG